MINPVDRLQIALDLKDWGDDVDAFSGDVTRGDANTKTLSQT